MLDCNQRWSLPEAIRNCLELAVISPYWIEEPTHPDDVKAHEILARAISPTKVAVGEHLPNRVVFKNYLQSQAMSFCQVDCTRVGGVSEFVTISLLARKYGVPVVPHVGDMGQIHQHLVLFNHIALGHDGVFLEYIPNCVSISYSRQRLKVASTRFLKSPAVAATSTERATDTWGEAFR